MYVFYISIAMFPVKVMPTTLTGKIPIDICRKDNLSEPIC